MGKREHDAGAKRSKKHKRHKDRHQQKKPSLASSADTETPIFQEEQIVVVDHVEVKEEQLEDLEEFIKIDEYEEEIECDGEVELPQDSELDTEDFSIDVEADAEEPPEPVLPKSNKRKSGGGSSNKSTTEATATPTAETKATPPPPPVPVSPPTTSTAAASASKKSKKRRESATSSDEERWLTAIESGKLEDVDDELKKIKDPKLMTARQRAMYERGQQDVSPGSELFLMSLPNGYREKEKPQTAEDIQKAALKSQRRKQQADEKREKNKKKTMERLLKKKDSNKQRSTPASRKATKAAPPMLTYVSTQDGVFIHVPSGLEFPLKAQKSPDKPLPPKQLCGIAGCDQPKVYNCSKTNLPLCSLACYRKNVQAVRQIMC